MSVKELQARIDKLSEEIETQRLVLNTIERSRSVLQRQLNEIHDPIARLPREISSEIFLQCLPRPPRSGIHHMPITLLNICNTWTDIALSITALWTVICVISPSCRGFRDVLEGWIKRARGHPLELRLAMTDKIDKDIAFVLRQHTAQLKRLEIGLEDGIWVYDIPFCEPEPLWVQKGAKGREPTSALHSLSIIGTGQGYLHHDWASILQLLRRSPSLVELSLHNTEFYPTRQGPVVSPNLRRFVLGQNLSDYESDEIILQTIVAPRLESLTLESARHEPGYE
ncbi:hypothetical protein FB45DRAFT_1000188 [Roridomyces roridus]|uniref:F-box domain-containing protein n=1 Tax=Roridomyces roridus TaxID=1738132 RepID=A0AAD7C825_9AGAR|nr:hypothetical protein FB45DRAFT_1000188 [Roridomyces roridus]